MKNVEMKMTGDKLIIEIDMTQDFGESKSGKSITIASTEGNKTVPGYPGVKIGINVFKKKDQ